MSLSFFLKAYLRIAAIVVVVALVCALLFHGINSVRSQYWHEQASAPAMRWLAATPDPLSNYSWLPPRFDLRQSSPVSLGLSPVIQERLGYGQVVSVRSDAGRLAYVLLPDQSVLALTLEQPERDLALLNSILVRWHLDNVPARQRHTLAPELGDALGVQVHQIEKTEDLPDQNVLQRLNSSGLTLFEHDDGVLRALMRLSDGALVQLIMPPPFNPWEWPVLLLLTGLVGGVIALGLYLGLRFVDGNLRKVESVAIRIARGELGARVEAEDGALVSRLALSFNTMAEHIQRLVQVQQEMIHAVSHELRTPVARIRFGVQMIEPGTSQAVLEKQLSGIDGDIQELDELIDEILTYARLEQGGPVFTLREASVTDIVQQVVAEQKLIREGIEIESRFSEGSERWSISDVEPRYIHRAVQNLVGNAARYAAGRVQVSCHLDEDNCRIDVEDDGPGIPESEWEKVFTAFARLDDSRTRNSGGYGLGLSIVRRILYWHGGQAFVGRSEHLGGARFSLVWPRRKAPDGLS
ncbi:two-component sensor histidine kinase [Marinobacter fuscus]|uniref:histidine kinase n=1 Tax=Marinobacter fuscus TaxID=2109942 RepID=A0A2T1KLQ1_9GAMM|nr:ATP-binding protein [Marinobacter fuscus]PSF10633.1 two-component sensor histidine kinase [Marinobacter fuscus]